MDFKDKIVIVTGAGSGIGAATALKFNAEGAHVVLVDRNEAKVTAIAKQCTAPLVLVADIANDDNVRNITEKTIENYGQIDVLVNNAGLTVENHGLLGSDMMKAYDTVMSINLRAVVHLTNLAAPYLVKTKGNIVNTSSIAAIMPPFEAGMTNYFTSKAGLNHFTVCAAAELGLHGVRVNAVNPGPVLTSFLENDESLLKSDALACKTILGRVSEADEIADLILYLASDKAKSITGSYFVTDNGMMIKRP